MPLTTTDKTIATPPSTLSQPERQTSVEPPVQPLQRDIPASLAPYLDPSIHPDLRFTPNTDSTETQSQALRLEIHLSRRQVTLYRGETVLKNYAIAIGRPGWETPVGAYEVKQMIKNPTWIHPLQKGVVIPGGDPEKSTGALLDWFLDGWQKLDWLSRYANTPIGR